MTTSEIIIVAGCDYNTRIINRFMDVVNGLNKKVRVTNLSLDPDRCVPSTSSIGIHSLCIKEGNSLLLVFNDILSDKERNDIKKMITDIEAR